MSNWFIDTGLATGDNDGTTIDDAWQSIKTGLELAVFNRGDLILVRRRSIETESADVTITDDGASNALITVLGWPRVEEGDGSGTWANGSTEINDVTGLEMNFTQHVGRRVKQDTDGIWYIITYIPYYRNTTLAFVDSGPDTITDTSSGFVFRGIKAGDKIRVTGSGANNGTFTVANVIAGTITLDAGDALTAEAAGAEVTIQVYDRFIIDSEYVGTNTGAFTIEEDEHYDRLHTVLTFTANHTTDIFTTATDHPWLTGDSVALTNSGGALPTGVTVWAPATGTPWYYIIRLSATTFKLATTYANALAGIDLTISDNGSGTHTVQMVVDGTITKANWDADADNLACIDLANAYHVYFNTAAYWSLQNIELRDGGNSTWGSLRLFTAYIFLMKNCIIRTSSNVYLINTSNDSILHQCIIDGMLPSAGSSQRGFALGVSAQMYNSAIYSCGDSGLVLNNARLASLYNVNIGVEVANGDNDINVSSAGILIGRDIKLGGLNGYFSLDNSLPLAYAKIENFQKVLGKHICLKRGGGVGTTGFYTNVSINDTGDVNSPSAASPAGSATDIIAIRPNSSGADPVRNFKNTIFTNIFNATTDNKTYTYYLQNYSCGIINQGDALRNLYLKAEYIDDYDDTSEYHHNQIYSSETAIAERADATDWDSLSVTVQPAIAGLVRITLYCSIYDATGIIYVDPTPLIA